MTEGAARLPDPASAETLAVLHAIAAGRDPFCGCEANGDFRLRLQLLADLRRAGLIDPAQRLTAPGRNALERPA